MTSYMYGVWQDGMYPTYLTYGSGPSEVYLGTHVANDPMFAFSTYPFSYWHNKTFNLSYCGSTYVASYIATYGITYAVATYRNVACNIRSIGWI
jgi:hypothetical protein